MCVDETKDSWLRIRLLLVEAPGIEDVRDQVAAELVSQPLETKHARLLKQSPPSAFPFHVLLRNDELSKSVSCSVGVQTVVEVSLL